MNSEKPNFLSQPVVKNIFVYRNGDPYYEARRVVVNEKRVSNFETFLREVTGGVQAPFGAVRNIYTPKAGHRVDSLEHLQSGEQYVAAGKEKFKKLDYQQIGPRKRRMLQTVVGQMKPVPQSRIIVSARFLKPIKEPCTIFVVANGDVLNPAVRLLIPQRVQGQYDRVLELITEKMGFRLLGGVRSLYTFDGALVNDGKDLDNGQFYVAVGREKFKRLPYSDLLFTKPRGMRRILGSKAASLPPIYRFSKQNGTSKSMAACSDSSDSKTSPQGTKEHMSSIVREISQARLISLRQKRSGLSMSLGVQDNDEADHGPEEGDREPANNTPQDPPADEPSKEDAPSEETAEQEVDAATGESTTEEVPDAGEKAPDAGEEKNQDDGRAEAPEAQDGAGPGEAARGEQGKKNEADPTNPGAEEDLPPMTEGDEENKNEEEEQEPQSADPAGTKEEKEKEEEEEKEEEKEEEEKEKKKEEKEKKKEEKEETEKKEEKKKDETEKKEEKEKKATEERPEGETEENGEKEGNEGEGEEGPASSTDAKTNKSGEQKEAGDGNEERQNEDEEQKGVNGVEEQEETGSEVKKKVEEKS